MDVFIRGEPFDKKAFGLEIPVKVQTDSGGNSDGGVSASSSRLE